MRRDFLKMHGLGNDFVVFDARAEPLALTRAQVRGLADRHTGIGCDQLIVVAASDRADAFMHIWNADGSPAEACGNAARCVATLLGAHATIDSAGGRLDAAATAGAASIVYPPPCFDWDAVPLAYPLDTGDVPAAWDALAHGVALSVGNPHIVFFVPDAAAVPLAELGPRIEHDPLFPARVNVGVAAVAGARPADPARVGARGRIDARLRHRRDGRGGGGDPSPPGRLAGDGRPARRRSDRRLGRRPDHPVGAGGDELHRHGRPVRTTA